LYCAPIARIAGENDVVLLGLVAAVTTMVGGVLWDISWDASIGVDSFWSPPHVATNFGAAAAGVCGLLLLWRTSPRSGRLEPGAARVAFGAAMAVWGSVAMLGFLILDDWWSRSYGLYGERWSPPEILFTVAGAAILAGAAIAAAATRRRGAATAALWVGGLAIAFAVAAMTPYGMPNLQRTGTFYLVSSLLFPLVLAWAAVAGRRSWSAVAAALFYAGFVCFLVWTLPLFAAAPRIGPIYEPVEWLIPPRFPLLLFLPAAAIDACVRRLGSVSARALACGAAFLLIFLPVQWLFASFLLSPASDNWLFAGGGRHWPFYVQMGPERSAFWGLDHDALSAYSVAVCATLAAVSSAAGLLAGAWTRGARR
jgi:hypothetical protein